MDFIKWETKYELGIEEIDKQHQQLIGILNRLYDAFVKKESDKLLGEILNEMDTYAQLHFNMEEEGFEKFKYEGKEKHIAEHTRYNETIGSFRADLEKGRPITFKVMNFLRIWWTEHILISDAKYVPTFVQNEKDTEG